MRKKLIVGIDEVGRGCLAGPVMVAASLFRPGQNIRSKKLGQLKDSKKLSALARENWLRHLDLSGVSFASARVYPATIDRINITQAANLAALRAFGKLLKKNNLSEKKVKVFLDGGLYLGRRGREAKFAKTVIRGDEKIKAIAAASIFAKVKRDNYMKKLGALYPQYGLESHKGYGTKIHLAAIRKFGIAGIHRRTFTKKI